MAFEFYTTSRSAWRKSLQVGIQRVLDGKLTAEDFRAAACPSPDPRDPDPIVKLDAAMRNAADGKRLAGEAEIRRTAEAKERAEKIESLRHTRCWRLAGFYMEDLSMARYTLAEIEAWVDWDGYNMRAKHPTVTAQADGPDNLTVDLSGRFLEVCGAKRPTVVNIEEACRRLAAYTKDRTEAAAPKN